MAEIEEDFELVEEDIEEEAKHAYDEAKHIKGAAWKKLQKLSHKIDDLVAEELGEFFDEVRA